MGPQPRRARGTVEQPYSALNLRLGLASIGVVAFAIIAAATFVLGYPWLGVIAIVAALGGLVDVFIIETRRRRRKATDRENHSLFE